MTSKGSEITPAQQQLEKIKAKIEAHRQEIADALPRHIKESYMLRVIYTALTRDPNLLHCTPNSIVQSVMIASQLGLPPDGVLGQGYLVPFKDHKQSKAKGKDIRHCQFIPGYRGLIQLARRSGDVSSVTAHCVYENDQFDYELGLNQKLSHRPARLDSKEPGKFRCAYCVVKLKDRDADPIFDVMFADEIERIRQKSQGRNSTAWVNDTDEMRRKTAVRRTLKYAPTSTEVQNAITVEEQVERGLLESTVDLTSPEPMPQVPDDPPPPEPEPEDVLDAEVVEEEDDIEPELVEPEEEAAPEPEPEEEEEEESKKGRITKAEDIEFGNLLNNLEDRGLKALKELAQPDPNATYRDWMEKKLASLEVESAFKIRSRDVRQKLLESIDAMISKLEKRKKDKEKKG